jgi:hypothetical protein
MFLNLKERFKIWTSKSASHGLGVDMTKKIDLYVLKTYWLVYVENGEAHMYPKPNGLYVVKSDNGF